MAVTTIYVVKRRERILFFWSYWHPLTFHFDKEKAYQALGEIAAIQPGYKYMIEYHFTEEKPEIKNE